MSNFIKEWTQREVDNLNRAFRRYSALVIVLKFILPLTALAMAVLLFIYPMLSGNEKKIVLVAQEAPKTGAPKENPVMENPRYQGIDSKNQQYQIAAKRAIQQKVDLMQLEGLTADITLNDGKWISLVANNGVYDVANKFVELQGDVNLFMTDDSADNYQMTTDKAFVDLANGIINGDSEVTFRSPSGTFSANSFVVERDKQKITFKGQVKLVILKK